MTLLRDWHRFWFARTSPVSLGLFRLIFGVIVLLYGLMLFPDRLLWFTDQGILTTRASDAYNVFNTWGPRLNLLHGVNDPRWLTAFFLVFLFAALGLMLGLWTRLSALAVFVALNSFHNRNHVITNGGDVVMMVMAAYLVLAPAGAACSLDRLRRIFQGRAEDQPLRVNHWVQRLMQVQVSLVYLSTGLGKLTGPDWQHGVALYYPLHLPEYARFPVPFIDGNHLWLVNLLTYGALLIELALGILVWVPRLRLPVLAAGVLLHLGIEYSLNIPLFSFLMIASYLLFLTKADLSRFLAWLPLHGSRLRLVYDGQCGFCRSSLLVVRFLDAFDLVTFLDGHDPEQLRVAQGVRFQNAEQTAIAVDARGRQFAGFFAFRVLLWRLPALWFLAPLMYLPGAAFLGQRAYGWVARNRSRLPVAPRYRYAAGFLSEQAQIQPQEEQELTHI